MPNSSLTVEQILMLLAEAPRKIASLTAGVGVAQLQSIRDDGGWTANDVLAHLRSCADMWGGGIVHFITQDRPTIRAINPRTWIKSTDYPQQKFTASLKAFARQRKELLAVLEALAPDDWSRAGIVTGAGKPLVRTVLSYAERIVVHERPHLKQIERIVNSMRIER